MFATVLKCFLIRQNGSYPKFLKKEGTSRSNSSTSGFPLVLVVGVAENEDVVVSVEGAASCFTSEEEEEEEEEEEV